jgi:DNA repair exonuclease SbcCD ATPase subunit
MFRTIPNGSILLRGELFVIKKLQDFAKECGVTDRAIQKHLVKYADELNGLYERKGPNGTWLSDAACDILRSKMKQQPIVVSDGSLARQAEELKAENVQLLKELHNVQTDIIELQRQNTKLIAENARISLLEADNEAKAQQLTDAEKSAQSANSKLSEATKAFEDKEQQLQAEIEQLRQQLESEKQRPLTLRERFFGRKN